jgi:hypothetical protein
MTPCLPSAGPDGNHRVMNVRTPTLTVYLPDPSTATGTAVIIAPGGGFVWLSIDSEGYDVAKWLAARGIASIVLKPRLFQVEGQDPAQVTQAANAALGAVTSNRSLIDAYAKYGIADGIRAVKVARRMPRNGTSLPNASSSRVFQPVRSSRRLWCCSRTRARRPLSFPSRSSDTGVGRSSR